MKCSRCGSDHYRKNGHSGYKPFKRKGTNIKQRYLCLKCGYNYTLPVASTAEFKNWGYPQEVHDKVLALRQNNPSLGYRRIAAQVGGGITHGTVRNWIFAHQIAMGERAPKPNKKPTPPVAGDVGSS